MYGAVHQATAEGIKQGHEHAARSSEKAEKAHGNVGSDALIQLELPSED